jgi:hypothetical protein
MVQRQWCSDYHCLKARTPFIPIQLELEGTSGLCSGMEPLIRGVLSNLIGEDDAKTIDIISNEVDIKSDGSWSIKFRHPERWVISCLHN